MANQPKNQENLENQNQPDPTQTQENLEQSTNIPAVTEITTQNNNNQPAKKTYTEEEMQSIHNLYGQALREKQQEIEAARNNPAPVNNQPTHNPEEDSQRLLTDPRSLIREEIKAAVAPLAEGLNQFRAMSVYDSLKQQFKVHPQYSKHFTVPNFEAYLDQVTQGLQRIDIPIMQQAIQQVLGYMVANGLYNLVSSNQPTTEIPTIRTPNVPTNQNNNQPNNQPNGNMSLPAHLRPSGSPPPSGGNGNLTPKGNPRRPLTELEKRVARERGQSEDDYLDFLYLPSNQVVKTDIGRPKK